MAQLKAESAEIIHQTLVSDSVIAPLLGEYHFLDGTTLQACSVMSPGQELPSLQKVTGAEIIIHDVAQVTSQPYLTNYSDVIGLWRVYLIAWPGSDGSTLNTIVSRMLNRFGNMWTIEISARGAALGATTQTLVMIRSTSAILPDM